MGMVEWLSQVFEIGHGGKMLKSAAAQCTVGLWQIVERSVQIFGR